LAASSLAKMCAADFRACCRRTRNVCCGSSKRLAKMHVLFLALFDTKIYCIKYFIRLVASAKYHGLGRSCVHWSTTTVCGSAREWRRKDTTGESRSHELLLSQSALVQRLVGGALPVLHDGGAYVAVGATWKSLYSCKQSDSKSYELRCLGTRRHVRSVAPMVDYLSEHFTRLVSRMI